MKLEYDSETDTAFIWIEPEINNKSKSKIINELWPKESNEHIGLLFGESNKLLAIEVLFASKYLSKRLLK